MRYFKNPTYLFVYGFDETDTSQAQLIQNAIDEKWEEVTGNWPPPLSSEELLALCKEKAQMFLQQTDWSEIPSVSDSSSIPYLVNVADFIDYRRTIRQLAVNPVINPIWPDMPKEQWGSTIAASSS